MIEPIGLRFAGDGRLVRVSPLSARDLLARLVEANALTRHELSLFELGDAADAAEGRLVGRLRWRRGQGGARRPALPPISTRELRRVEGLVSARVLDGAWRLTSDEGRLLRGHVPGAGRVDRRRCEFVPLFGAIFEVERLRFASLCVAGRRDVLVERADRTFRLLRFEGVAAARDGRGLVLRWRDRMRLDRGWEAPIGERSEAAALRWYGVRAVVPQEGFAFLEGPSLLG